MKAFLGLANVPSLFMEDLEITSPSEGPFKSWGTEDDLPRRTGQNWTTMQ